MPRHRIDLRTINNILGLKDQGALSHRAIARSLSISKGVAAKHLGRAAAAGLDWQATAELDKAALERRLLGRSAADIRAIEADFARVHIELRRKGVTLVLVWQEHRAAHEGRRTRANTQFCEHYKAFTKTLKRSVRQNRRARKPGSGDCLGIDLDNTVCALDAGTIDLCLSGFEWASFRFTKAAIKLHTLLGLGRCQPRLHPHQRWQAARPGHAGHAELRVRGGLRGGSRPCRLRAARCAAPGRRLLRHQRSAISGRCSTAAARPGSFPSI